MRKLISSAAIVVCGLGVVAPVYADSGQNAISIAVYGDAPYGCKKHSDSDPSTCPLVGPPFPDRPEGPIPGDPEQLNATPAFIDAVNSDPDVRLVLFVGDIHSGSQFCTLKYDRTIFDLWTKFKDPLVYTPGDNEWSDCHKSAEGGVTDPTKPFVDYANGDPVANLALVRATFFTSPGQTLGERKKLVTSQAKAYDHNHESDAEYVENVIWEDSGVLFVTLNIPGGSNNDDDTWYASTPTDPKTPTQIQEIKQRTDADLRWLDVAFAKATADGVRAVVILEQSDMWDLDGKSASHIANYEKLITPIAVKTKAFGKPVLEINGDSHNYRSDNPLKDGQPCAIESGPNTIACADDAWDNHSSQGYDVANFHRLVVHGATMPLEYLRLTVDPKANNATTESTFGPFSWERVIP